MSATAAIHARLAARELLPREHFVDSGYVDARCVEAGFVPQIRLEAAELLSALGLVSAGLGLALIQQSIGCDSNPNVVLRKLPWLKQSIGLWAAWHRVDLRPIVSEFRQIVLAGAEPQGTS